MFNKVHSTTILTVLTESVLSQNLGKCIHYLVIHTDGKDHDKTKLLMFSKMMVTNMMCFILGPNFGKWENLLLTRPQKLAIYRRLSANDLKIPISDILHELHDGNDIS